MSHSSTRDNVLVATACGVGMFLMAKAWNSVKVNKALLKQLQDLQVRSTNYATLDPNVHNMILGPLHACRDRQLEDCNVAQRLQCGTAAATTGIRM